MRITSREINGYRFGFIVGSGVADGVSLDPGVMRLTEPIYLYALAEAERLYKTLDAVQQCYEFKGGNGLAGDEQYLLEAMDNAKLALNQTDWNIGDDDVRDANWILENVPKELERRKQKAEIQAAKEAKQASRKLGRAGFVYLVNEVNGPHYKIGRSKNPDDRTATFGVKLPYKVEYECVIQTPDMYALESELHTRFADKRADGEWFALLPEDVDYIKALAGGEL